MKYTLYLFTFTFLTCCQQNKEKPSTDLRKEAIAMISETEKAFEKMASEKGSDSAFAFFAAEDAVLDRGESLVKGKDSILNYFASRKLTDVHLEWHPDYIDASKSGDLGYTYGPYTFSAKDSTGKEIKSKGIFHTVWKKQVDGTWKFVWD
jgi:ketosteroid isomerase-like protein